MKHDMSLFLYKEQQLLFLRKTLFPDCHRQLHGNESLFLLLE